MLTDSYVRQCKPKNKKRRTRTELSKVPNKTVLPALAKYLPTEPNPNFFTDIAIQQNRNNPRRYDPVRIPLIQVPEINGLVVRRAPFGTPPEDGERFRALLDVAGQMQAEHIEQTINDVMSGVVQNMGELRDALGMPLAELSREQQKMFIQSAADTQNYVDILTKNNKELSRIERNTRRAQYTSTISLMGTLLVTVYGKYVISSSIQSVYDIKSDVLQFLAYPHLDKFREDTIAEINKVGLNLLEKGARDALGYWAKNQIFGKFSEMFRNRFGGETDYDPAFEGNPDMIPWVHNLIEDGAEQGQQRQLFNLEGIENVPFLYRPVVRGAVGLVEYFYDAFNEAQQADEVGDNERLRDVIRDVAEVVQAIPDDVIQAVQSGTGLILEAAQDAEAVDALLDFAEQVVENQE